MSIFYCLSIQNNTDVSNKLILLLYFLIYETIST